MMQFVFGYKVMETAWVDIRQVKMDLAALPPGYTDTVSHGFVFGKAQDSFRGSYVKLRRAPQIVLSSSSSDRGGMRNERRALGVAFLSGQGRLFPHRLCNPKRLVTCSEISLLLSSLCRSSDMALEPLLFDAS